MTVEYRWAGNEYERLRALAVELVRRRVNVIATEGQPWRTRRKDGDYDNSDRVPDGRRPRQIGVGRQSESDGDLTGVTTLNTELTPKRVEVLRELVPTTTIMAVLVNPTNIRLTSRSN